MTPPTPKGLAGGSAVDVPGCPNESGPVLGLPKRPPLDGASPKLPLFGADPKSGRDGCVNVLLDVADGCARPKEGTVPPCAVCPNGLVLDPGCVKLPPPPNVDGCCVAFDWNCGGWPIPKGVLLEDDTGWFIVLLMIKQH